MVLCWEIENPRLDKGTKEVWLPEPHRALSAPFGIIAEHLRKALLEGQRHAFSHDTYAIDRVDERLSVG